MRLGRIGRGAYFHRFLTAKWSWQPFSGAGAAINGGRFNRPGVHALYLGSTPQTALAEYLQGAIPRRPATMAAYRIDFDFDIVDLSGGFRPDEWSPEWSDWDCDWQAIGRIDKRDPPSWRLGDTVIREGYRALQFPSTKLSGGRNLVIFPPPTGPLPELTAAEIAVHDPEGDMPVDGQSWPAHARP